MRQMLLAPAQNTAVNTISTAFQWSNYPILSGPNFENMHYIGASTCANRRDDNDYFELWVYKNNNQKQDIWEIILSV